MATKKISQLEAMTSANSNDVIPIVDVTEGETKKITKADFLIETGHSVELTIDSSYQLVLKLKNEAGTVLSTQTVDLPNENAITSIEYNNGKLILTKQSGTTSQVDISGLIEGLVTESDFNTFTEQLQEVIDEINEDIEGLKGRVTETEGDISDIQEDIEALQAENERQQEEIEDLENNSLTDTPELATSYHFVDSAKAKFRKFLPEGHSEQETTEGYNIFDYPTILATKIQAGLMSINEKGQVVLNGTFDASNRGFRVTLPAGTYCGKDTSNIFHVFWDGTDKLMNTTSSRTLTEETTMNGYIASGTYSNQIIEPMIYAGEYDANKQWEKYTNGASPNPSYEQPIESCGENVNLLQNTGVSSSNNGVDFTVNSDGTVIANGTATALAQKVIARNVTFNAGTYTIKDAKAYIESDGYTGWFDGLNTAVSYNFTTDFTMSTVYIQVPNGTTVTNKIFYPKLEKGSQATPYSPYGMGSITKKIINKNWFDKNNMTVLDNANISSASVINIENNFALIYVLLKAGTYCISNNIGSYQWVLSDSLQVPKIGNTVSARQVTTGTNAVYTLNEEKYLLIRVAKSTVSISDFIENLQIELGSTATDYVPHEEQDYSIFVQQPFRSIGDVRDCFIKLNGVWYERHYIGYLLLNGTEDGWSYASTTQGSLFRNINVIESIENQTPLSNYFKGRSNATGRKDGEFYFNYGAHANHKTFDFMMNDIDNLEDFKTWLSTHNVEVQAKLATPLDLPCTEEQTQQLENRPSTYKTETNVLSEDEIEAYIDAEYVRDLETVINELQAQILG